MPANPARAAPTPAAIIAAARGYLGTPFHHQGRVRGVGVDCAGLLVCTARDLGATPLDLPNYDHEPDPKVIREYLNAQMQFVRPQEATLADVLLMQFPRHRVGFATHLAILTDIGIIHAYAPARKVVETALEGPFRTGIMGAYRWRF
ncbi:MAG: peptidase P60 [Gammaproteobacteria bacterium]|nr:peptidase P60 [Gammaproteobacteria bacterium]